MPSLQLLSQADPVQQLSGKADTKLLQVHLCPAHSRLPLDVRSNADPPEPAPAPLGLQRGAFRGQQGAILILLGLLLAHCTHGYSLLPLGAAHQELYALCPTLVL